MQRPKQQALAFLLGALLVGGVVGFSADRAFRREDQSIAGKRRELYDDLGLAESQRARLDSVFDDRNCRFDAALKSVQPALDSLRVSTRARMDLILTPDQRVRLDARRKDDDVRHDAERQRIKSACRS